MVLQDKITGYIKELNFAGGFHKVTFVNEIQKKLNSAHICMDRYMAVDEKSALIFDFAYSDQNGGVGVHVKGPLTSPLVNAPDATTLAKVLMLNTYLQGANLVLDEEGRICLNWFKSFDKADPKSVISYLNGIVEYYNSSQPLCQELQKQGLTIGFKKDAALQKAIGNPVKLSAQEMQALAGGSWGSFLLGCAEGLGIAAASVVIGVGSAGIAAGVMVGAELVGGAALA